MSRVEWASVPERYWPDTDTPWRVVSGFGAFEDFATEDEALNYGHHLRSTLTNGWQDTVQDPFNIKSVAS